MFEKDIDNLVAKVDDMLARRLSQVDEMLDDKIADIRELLNGIKVTNVTSVESQNVKGAKPA